MSDLKSVLRMALPFTDKKHEKAYNICFCFVSHILVYVFPSYFLCRVSIKINHMNSTCPGSPFAAWHRGHKECGSRSITIFTVIISLKFNSNLLFLQIRKLRTHTPTHTETETHILLSFHSITLILNNWINISTGTLTHMWAMYQLKYRQEWVNHAIKHVNRNFPVVAKSSLATAYLRFMSHCCLAVHK
jgi:hypothetical protein